MFWNVRKIYNLPKYLKARLKKVFYITMFIHNSYASILQTRCDLERLKKDLLLLQDEVGKDLTPEYCKQCCHDIQSIAKNK